jgi:hypothetical protein
MPHAVSGIASQTGRGSISSGLLFNFDVYEIAVQPFACRRGKDDLRRMSLELAAGIYVVVYGGNAAGVADARAVLGVK